MDTPDSAIASASLVRARLQDASEMVRESSSLDPEVSRSLSELLAELGRALESSGAAPSEVARLAESAAHLAESLHKGHDHGLLRSARASLDGLLLQAEARAPTAVGLARQVIDGLANLGI